MKEPLRVLVAEDNESDFDLLLLELRRGGYAPVSKRVETGEALTAALASQSWDLVISDWSMPHFSGLDALALLKQRGLDLPFIIVSGTVGEETAVAALQAGALDFFVKGKFARLLPAVEKALLDKRARAESEQALANSEAQVRRVQEQLIHAQKMEAIGVLAGGVAHDFNNLLSVILTYSEMGLRQLLQGEPLWSDLDEIRKAGQQAEGLTRQLLAFSRRQVLETQVIDLNDLVLSVAKMLRRLIGEDIVLTALPSKALGAVRVDPGQMEQVLMNLTVNARDAMPRGGRLTIETANVLLTEDYVREHLGVTPGAYVMLAVSDTGIGMDKATQARIFEPFFTTKEKGKGTGLGLSTVFGIVQQSKGHIWVYSEPGQGTTFKIYLPRTDEATTVAEAESVELTELSGTETILLVEDEDQLRTMLGGLLRAFGYHVLEARNGGEALLIAEQRRAKIHLLLTDVVMPYVSGPELAQRLGFVRSEMKVLCMSGYADEAILNHGIIDAGLAYLQKPITPDKLARKIREVLAAPRRLSDPTATPTGPSPDAPAARPSLGVDDEPAMLQVYLRALRAAGLQVEGAENGLRALALLQERDFDVIISDISMPGMDGMHLLRAVRQRDLDVPVILMTGDPTLETSLKAIEYGAFRYMTKPFELGALIDAVQQAQRLYKLARLRRQAGALLGARDKQLGDRMALENGFERALGTLWMAYQPIVSWAKRKIFAYEALVRTTEPTIPHPGALLAAAERLDRLPDLGRAIRDHVATVVAKAPCECIFVNLHTRDLLDEQLYSSAAPLSKVAKRVVLEITERAALDDVPDSRARVARLRQLGFRIALDDLGAGYAGLTAFAQLEPEVVKFDMSLIRGLHLAPAQRKLVTSMATLCSEMGLLVVAEGVETSEERDAVVLAGCGLIQGYLFARPGKPFPAATW